MADICDPRQFPETPYFEQHELAEFGPYPYDYQHTRGLLITTNSSPFSAELRDVLFSQSPYPGVPFDPANAATAWEAVIKGLFGVPAVSNPFDFTLWFRSRIAIRIEDSFWWFSTKMAPITMKHQYGAQYFDLLLHDQDAAGQVYNFTLDEWRRSRPNIPCRCISFFTRTPCDDPASHPGAPQVFHGFSLNMELGTFGSNVLPMTIDPDIENKGGNPGP